MAPSAAPARDLATCFTGEQPLVTWDSAYRALCDPATAARSDALRAFLTAPDHLDTLSHPWQPFADASTHERARFDAATAPIHLTPAPTGHYDLDEIKRDALWLSQQAHISEYAALHLVIAEWQTRPATHLLSGLTPEEALSVHDAAGGAALGASTFLPNSSILARPPAPPATDPPADDLRRLRILGSYHSACAAILRVSQLLVSWAAASQLRSQTIYGNDYLNLGAGWIEEVGQAIVSRQHGSSSSNGVKPLDECLKAVIKRCDRLEAGADFSLDESLWDAVSENWLVAQTTELLHLLHLALIYTDLVVKDFIPAATIEDWLGAFLQRGFFCNFPTHTPRQEPLVPIIHLLTSLLSLALLKVDGIIDDLSSGKYKHWDPSSYILNTPIVENITTIFGEATRLGQSPALPAIFAWAITIFKVTEQATYEEQERERLLDDHQTSQDPSPIQTALEECAATIRGMNDSEIFNDTSPYEALAHRALDHSVFGLVNQLTGMGILAFGTDIDRVSRDRLRLLFLQLIRAALGSDIVQYCPELIITTYTILAGEKTFCTWVDADASQGSDPVVSYFLEDEYVLRPTLLDYSRLRYPYETTPFLKFCSVLTRGDKTLQNGMPTFVEKLTNINRLMQLLPQGFRDFALTREDENNNWVELTADLPLFSSGPAASFGSQRRLLSSNTSTQSGQPMNIPAGTEGIIIDEGKQPYVAIWYHQHATLHYLCQLLSTYPVGTDKVECATQLPAPRETVVEIVGFFADLLHASLRFSEGVCSDELLENLGINSDSSRDTVSVILAVFEQELLHLAMEPNDESSLELLVNCTHFLEALIIISPHRVWPWLARSRLLEGDGSGSLATILIGTEMVLGRYDFLIGCIRIYKGLVKDAVERSVSRKTPTKALSRFNATATPSESGTSEKMMSTVLFTFGRTLASMYETSLSWKYSRPEHRPEINTAICEIFTTILKFAYGVDDAPKLSAKLTKSIAPIAEYITQLYTAESKSELPTNPVLAALVLGVGPNDMTLLTSSRALWTKQTRTTLVFSDILVRISILLNKPWTHLEQQLFKATPLLARLYATSDAWKSQVVILLEALVRGAVRVTGPGDAGVVDGTNPTAARKQTEQQEPPSLLGHLGPSTAKNFLSVLSQLDEPLHIVDIQTNVWNLLSAVVTCRQQWFSLYLLTGSTPRESLRTKADAAASTRNRALLTRALKSLSSLTMPDNSRTASAIPWPLYTAMLDFVSSAQNNWSWAMVDLRERKDLIKTLLAFLRWMAKQPKNLRTNNEILERSYQNRFASLACEVISMYLHSSRQAGDGTVLRDVVPCLEYLETNALELPTYNASLHSYLQKNVERQYPGVSLANLKRTTLYPESFGKSFFYDPALCQQLLSFDSKWSGPREGTGIASDLEKANFNLGLVESQVLLLQGWKLLALELSHVVGKDERLVRILNGVITKCMVANAQSNLPEALFGQLVVMRADLAFAILKKLVEAKVQSAETRQLLGPVWNAIRSSTSDFDSVFASDSVHYYRSLLRILYLALHFHLVDETDDSEETSMRSSFRGTVPASRHTLAESISTQLLEMLGDTVAKGFRSLATQLHTDPLSVSPSDFALLTALLQRIIAVPEMSKWQAQTALLFANHTTMRFATSLFSWSDRLSIHHHGIDDPVYGELSILFLLSLSSIPALAETMAVEGILSQLHTAHIMSYFRRTGGMGPFDNPTRMYAIWTKGVLPLCLNLLLSVGAPMASEISNFLNQYPEQLLRASASIPSSARITATKMTLSTASELHSLALLSSIIEDVRRQGPKLGIQSNEVALLDWEKEGVKEDLESWLGRKGTLRERVVPCDEREAAMASKRREGGDDDDDDDDDGCEGSVLEERVIAELEGASVVLGVGRK